MDGWITIGTELSTDKFNKQYDRLNKKIEYSEKQLNKTLEKKSKIQERYDELKKEFDGEKKLFDENLKEREKWRELKDTLDKGTPEQINAARNYRKYAIITSPEEVEALNEKQKNLEKEQQTLTNINEKYERQKYLLSALKEDAAELQKKIKITQIQQIQNSINNIGKSISNVTKKVIHWGLAIFSVRSMYFLVRQAMSTLTQYNDQLAIDIEYIRFAIAMTLERFIKPLVEWVFKLLQYVNYLTMAWFNLNLFEKATVDTFNKSNKSAEKLKKTLAGFDEMNVLSDNSSNENELKTPSVDLSKMENFKAPEWLEWIKNHGKEIAITLGLIGAALLGIKIFNFIKGVATAVKTLTLFKTGLALVVGGILLLVGSIANLILNWDKMTTKQKVISIALATLGAAFIALGYAIATGISVATLGIGAIIAAVVALIAIIGTFIFKLATEKSAIESVTDAQKKLTDAKEKARQAEDDYINSVENAENAQKRLKEAQDATGLSGAELNALVEQGILDFKDMTKEQREVYKAYRDNEEAQKKLKDSTEKVTQAKKDEKKASIDLKLATYAEKEEFDKYKNAVVEAFNKGELSANEARNRISKAMAQMSNDSRKTFVEDLPSNLKEGLDPSKYETTGQKLKNWFGNLWDTIKKGWGDLTGSVTINTTSSNSKRNKNAKGAIYYPKLAVGGIINMPGRGVPYHGATIGERGAEAVVPLTDSQQMALLGEAIGKYITVNATIVNSMNGRVLNRELQKLQNQTSFAMNGR